MWLSSLKWKQEGFKLKTGILLMYSAMCVACFRLQLKNTRTLFRKRALEMFLKLTSLTCAKGGGSSKNQQTMQRVLVSQVYSVGGYQRQCSKTQGMEKKSLHGEDLEFDMMTLEIQNSFALILKEHVKKKNNEIKKH